MASVAGGAPRDPRSTGTLSQLLKGPSPIQRTPRLEQLRHSTLDGAPRSRRRRTGLACSTTSHRHLAQDRTRRKWRAPSGSTTRTVSIEYAVYPSAWPTTASILRCTLRRATQLARRCIGGPRPAAPGEPHCRAPTARWSAGVGNNPTRSEISSAARTSSRRVATVPPLPGRPPAGWTSRGGTFRDCATRAGDPGGLGDRNKGLEARSTSCGRRARCPIDDAWDCVCRIEQGNWSDCRADRSGNSSQL